MKWICRTQTQILPNDWANDGATFEETNVFDTKEEATAYGEAYKRLFDDTSERARTYAVEEGEA